MPGRLLVRSAVFADTRPALVSASAAAARRSKTQGPTITCAFASFGAFHARVVSSFLPGVLAVAIAAVV